MEMESRITYDDAELIQILESELDRLNIFRFDSRYRALLGSKFIEKLEKWDSDIRKQKDSPLTLVVCGEFKRGKSSLINALLGEDVASVNVTTETITVNKISYGPHENAIILSGGKRIILGDDELSKEKLGPILAELPEKGVQLHLKRPIELLKDVTIVDTPGTGDSMTDFSDAVIQSLQQADAVVYVYSVSYPISVQEQLFIRTAVKPQKYTELFIIGNSADILENEEDCERIKRVTEDRIRDILPGESPLLLSALDERCRELGKKRPNESLSEYFENNFGAFREKLLKLLYEKRSCVIPDRIERLTGSMLADLREDLQAISKGADMNISDAQKKTDELNLKKELFTESCNNAYKRIDSISEDLRGESLEWFEDLLTEMEKDTDSLSRISAEDIKKYYSTYCADVLQEAISKCIDYFLVSIYNYLDDISESISQNLSHNALPSVQKFRISLQNKTWTAGDNIAFFTGALLPLPAMLAVNYAAGAVRQSKIKSSVPDLIEEIRSQYPKLKASALKSLSDTYSEVSSAAKKQVLDYFNEQAAKTAEQAEQFVMIARQDEKSKQDIKAAVKDIDDVFKAISDKFISLRNEALNVEVM